MTLQKFIDNPELRNKWIKSRKMKIYIRRSMRQVGMKMTPCLDLASVEVDENHRGKGLFTKFLEKFENAAKEMNRVVFVENIQNERLKNFLLRRKYKFYQYSNEFSVCLIKRI